MPAPPRPVIDDAPVEWSHVALSEECGHGVVGAASGERRAPVVSRHGPRNIYAISGLALAVVAAAGVVVVGVLAAPLGAVSAVFSLVGRRRAANLWRAHREPVGRRIAGAGLVISVIALAGSVAIW